MNQTIELGRIAGIRIGVNWSWLIVCSSSGRDVLRLPSQNPGLSDGEHVVIPVAAASLFFASLLLHELGHALQATEHCCTARRARAPIVQVRFARHTNRLDELVRFYRDGLGLLEIGHFEDHEGYRGVFLAVPGTDTHLEFTSGGAHEPPLPHPETLLVLYLGSRAAVTRACERVGTEPLEPANPYWQEHGVTLADPDGFRVVLVSEWWSDS